MGLAIISDRIMRALPVSWTMLFKKKYVGISVR
jgi:hypothetical protein